MNPKPRCTVDKMRSSCPSSSFIADPSSILNDPSTDDDISWRSKTVFTLNNPDAVSETLASRRSRNEPSQYVGPSKFKISKPGASKSASVSATLPSATLASAKTILHNISNGYAVMKTDCDEVMNDGNLLDLKVVELRDRLECTEAMSIELFSRIRSLFR